MSRFFITKEQITKEEIKIIGQDVNHIKNVLRAKTSEELEICNIDTKKVYICEIKELNKENIKCKIKYKIENNSESNINVNIFQGLPKNEKMELIIQKAVELGAYSITPVEMKRCIVKLDQKDKIKKIEKWQKHSEGAAKQSGRDIIPKIENIIKMKNIKEYINNFDVFIVAYEEEKNNTLKKEIEQLKKANKKELKIGILIGPEGGIDKAEINELVAKGAKIVTLGNRILRTETVALNILSIIMYELEK